LVLTVGVGNYLGMAAVYRDLDNSRANYYNQYNLTNFTLDLKRAPETAVERLPSDPNILRLRPRVKTEVMVRVPRKTNRLIPGIAVSLPVPKQNIINNVKMINGTWFSSSYAKEVILEEQFANARNIHVGDRITVRLPDKEHELLVVGIAASPEFAVLLAPGTLVPDPKNYAAMFMPHKFMQEACNLDGSFNQLLGLTRDSSRTALNNTMTLLSDQLDNYGVQLQTARQDDISVQVLHDELVNLKKSTTILPTMFLLVAALILNVMINRLVVQQRIMIGTLKAVGYTNFAIMCHYLSYALVIGVIGGILGDVLGVALQWLMLAGYKGYFAIPDMRVHIYLDIIIFGILISVISAFIGAVSGAYKATKLAPAEAMRPPVPEKGAHIILEHLTIFWQHLSFQGKMIMRAIFRNRFRSLVTIAASIIATALVFSSLQFLDAIYEMVDSSFVDVQHQDYTMTLREPLGDDIIRTNEILPGVKNIETQLSVASELKHGPYMKRLGVTGLPDNNQLYTPVDKYGKKIKIIKSGLIINKTLADILQVNIGDTVILRPLIGNRMPAKVPISNIIKTYMGLVVYADQVWLSKLIGDTNVSNSILFKLHKNADATKFIDAVSNFFPMINLTERLKEKQRLIETLNQFLVFTVIILIIFAGVIAVGSVINTAMISLNERQRDVASLRVLGYTNMQTAKIFFGESIILNSIGIFLGLFVGIYFAYYMSTAFSTEIYRMPMVIKIGRLLQTALIMFIFVVISQVIIYRMIKKLDWFEVLNARE
jgi:putative ABC transport system permease protein